MESIKFSDFIEVCDTGDLLLYSSNHWYSRLIEFFGWSKYSHVSMIIKDPIWIDSSLKGLYIFESGGESISVDDVIENKNIYGVQLIKLEDALKEYKNDKNGYIYYIKNNFERSDTFYDNLKNIIIQNDGKPYDLNIKDWIGARFNLSIINRESIRFFCSALIGYTLTNLNFLSKDTDWTIISPKEYSFYENSRLNFINCEMNPEKIII
jgi:hypothetical protein